MRNSIIKLLTKFLTLLATYVYRDAQVEKRDEKDREGRANNVAYLRDILRRSH